MGNQTSEELKEYKENVEDTNEDNVSINGTETEAIEEEVEEEEDEKTLEEK